MKSKSKKSFLNLSTAITYKLVTIIVGLLLPRLFITSYGSELNGLRDSVRQIFSYIALLEAGVGASVLQSLYKPVAQEDHAVANSYLSAMSTYYNRIGLLYFLALFVLGTGYALAVPVEDVTKWEVFLYVLVSGALTGINFFYLAKLNLLIHAEGDQYLISIVTMATYVASSIAKIVLIYQGVHIIIVEAAFLVVNLLATVVYYIVAKRMYPWISFRAKPDYECTKQKNAVMVHRVSSVIFQNVDVLLLTFFCSLEIVSIYGMYKMVVNMVTSVVTEFGNSVNFLLGQKFNTEDESKAGYCKLIDMYNVYYSALSFALYTTTYVLILPFMRLYTEGMDINYIYPVLPIIYIVMELLMVGREAMTRTVEVAGHFKKTQIRSLIELIINIVSSVVFVLLGKHFYGEIGGIYGVLLGTVVALLYRTTDINLYANKHILHRRPTKTFGIMVSNACMAGAVALAVHFFPINIDSYIAFLWKGALTAIAMIVLFVTMQSLLNRRECKEFLSRARAVLRRGR